MLLKLSDLKTQTLTDILKNFERQSILVVDMDDVKSCKLLCHFLQFFLLNPVSVATDSVLLREFLS